MSWWLSGRGCLAPNAGGCDPCPPGPCCGPFVWEAPLRAQQNLPLAPVVGHKGDHGGACCGSCAEGGACETACKDKKAESIVGALYVSDAELDALGTQVALMNSDVEDAAAAERLAQPGGKRSGASSGIEGLAVAETGIEATAHKISWDICREQNGTWNAKTFQCDATKPDPTHASFGDVPSMPGWPLTRFLDDEWRSFYAQWGDYRGETVHAPTTYDMLRTKFSTLHDRWTGPLKQTTRSSVPAPLSETSGANAIPWGWIALGGAVVALPFMLPALAGTYLALTRGRSLGL